MPPISMSCQGSMLLSRSWLHWAANCAIVQLLLRPQTMASIESPFSRAATTWKYSRSAGRQTDGDKKALTGDEGAKQTLCTQIDTLPLATEDIAPKCTHKQLQQQQLLLQHLVA